ncbi:hypothetical protein LCGC14_2659980 [marine sediment metagenome]|uniref:Uncharacterized protein n=1 Tax=marine sediment metagenome TaxID=412755 RepID=A0A0F9CJ42_9ZZZZ
MPRLPTPPRIALPTIRSPLPRVPLVPFLNKIAPRTLTGLIPTGVRDLVRFSGLVGRQFFGVTPTVNQGEVLVGSAVRRDESAYYGGGSGGQSITRGYLADVQLSNDLLFFQFNPSEVRVTHAPGWIISQTPGRSHPFVQYGGSGQRKISFTLKLAYTLNHVGNVQDNVNWIHSFLFPASFGDPSEGLISAPKPLLLYLGQIIARGEEIKAVPVILLKADVRYHTMMRPEELEPQFADISLEFLALMDASEGKPIQTGLEQRSTFGQRDTDARTTLLTARAAVAAGGV